MTQRSRQRFASALAAASLSLALVLTSSPMAFADEVAEPQDAPVAVPVEKDDMVKDGTVDGEVVVDSEVPVDSDIPVDSEVPVVSDRPVDQGDQIPIADPISAGGSVMEAKITRDEAVKLAQSMFSIPAELGEPSASKSQSKEGASWSLEWSTPEKQPERTNISVQVDAINGVILSYYKRSYSPSAPVTLPTYTKAEAQKVAETWFAKLIGGGGQTYKRVDTLEGYGYYGPVDAGYNFSWVRMEQGYPARNEPINISIDARTGELLSFNRYGDQNLTYTLPETLLSQAEAEGVYRKSTEMLLYWQHFQPAGVETGEWKLVYRPLTGFQSIDQTGALLDYEGKPVDLSKRQPMTRVPAPDKPYTPPEKPLTEAEALAIAKEVSGRTEAPTYVNYGEYGKGEQQTQSWHFGWNVNGELKEGEYNTDIQIDAVKGVVLNYGEWGPWQPPKENEKPKITQAEARDLAVAFVRKVRPDLAGNLMLMPSDPQEEQRVMQYGNSSYMVNFTAMRDGILVSEWTANVNVDARTGRVQNFWYNDGSYITAEFPATPANLLKPADALGSFFKYQGLELAWNVFYGDLYAAKMSDQAPVPTAKLVWMPSPKMSVDIIDAVTGAPLDYEGHDVAQLSQFPTDIEGIAAQREIELLWPRRIFDLKDGKFRPNETARASDLARWLVLARGMRPYAEYSFALAFSGMGARGAEMAKNIAAIPDAAYFGAAFQSGIILPQDFGDSTDPNAPVSRELFALWVVRAMGYSRVANMPRQIEMDLADKNEVDAKYANAVALLSGLGYLEGGASNRFYPKQNINRGDAAKLLFAVVAEVRQ